MPKAAERTKLCSCGCGELVEVFSDNRNREYKKGHVKNIRTKILCKCGCGEEILSHDKRGRVRIYKTGHQFKGIKQSLERRQNTSKRMKKKTGKKNNNWKGGRYVGKYIEWWTGPKEKIPEHRLIMEVYLCRPLTDEEVVHHINGNKHDNSLDNLYLCSSKSTHRLLHHSMDNLTYSLMKDGIVKFDKEKGAYVRA